MRLALAFGNHDTDGACPYARASRCHHCDIGFGEGIQFNSAMNIKRLEWFKAHYKSCWSELAHLLIYNAGSTLNPRELAPDVCDHIVSFARSLPKLRQLSMDSREAFVTTDYVRHLALGLGAGKRFGIILGIESADDHIRNVFLNKKMPAAMIEKALMRFSQAWDIDREQYKKIAEPALLVNLVVGSPGTTASTVIDDSLHTAHYAIDLANKYHLPLDLNIHPYYPSKHGLKHFPDHPRASPTRVIEVITQLKKLCSSRVQFFVGMQDEGHDQQPEQRHKDAQHYLDVMEVANNVDGKKI